MLKIGTHNGTFHCDEVLACFLLRQLPQYKESEIIRTRDPLLLNSCDIVVDVGGIFDPKTHRYDHHQKAFNETFKTLKPEKPWDIKLSSAGLIYVYFGEQILTEMCKEYHTNIDINILYDKMYEHFVLEIDAIDNGISICEGEPRYSISSLSGRVGHINPWWNKKGDEQACFENAMKLVGSEFIDKMNFYVNCWWPARELVQKSIDARYDVHKSGLILKFEQTGCPWKSHFFDLEKNMKELVPDNQQTGDTHLSPYQIRFVLFSDGKTWRVQCIPINEKQGFINRLGLLEEWRGIRDEELCKISGIPDSVFVHATGFIGGNKTYDGALQMALKTLEHAGLIN